MLILRPYRNTANTHEEILYVKAGPTIAAPLC